MPGPVTSPARLGGVGVVLEERVHIYRRVLRCGGRWTFCVGADSSGASLMKFFYVLDWAFYATEGGGACFSSEGPGSVSGRLILFNIGLSGKKVNLDGCGIYLLIYL